MQSSCMLQCYRDSAHGPVQAQSKEKDDDEEEASRVDA